jgi:hypothetical protein
MPKLGKRFGVAIFGPGRKPTKVGTHDGGQGTPHHRNDEGCYESNEIAKRYDDTTPNPSKRPTQEPTTTDQDPTKSAKKEKKKKNRRR